MSRVMGKRLQRMSPLCRWSCRGESGLTLLEMVIAIAITAILAGLMARLLSGGVDMYEFVSTRRDALQEARVGVQRISRELRQITSPESILTAGNSEIRYYRRSTEEIHIEFEGSRVLLNNQPLVEGVTDLEFHYFDDTRHELPPPIQNLQKIKMIKFKLAVELKGHEVEFDYEVQPRNF